jgi:hypothetical protein
MIHHFDKDLEYKHHLRKKKICQSIIFIGFKHLHIWHVSPWNPGRHRHVKLSKPCDWHVPPFMHGFGMQISPKISNKFVWIQNNNIRIYLLFFSSELTCFTTQSIITIWTFTNICSKTHKTSTTIFTRTTNIWSYTRVNPSLVSRHIVPDGHGSFEQSS